MFNLLKDLDRYKGQPPYDSELYGVYQPLLGWESSLTRAWVDQPGQPDPRIKRMIDARIQPAPTSIQFSSAQAGGGFTIPAHYNAVPLAPGTIINNVKVGVTRDLNSGFMRMLCEELRVFAAANGSKLPADPTAWRALLPDDKLTTILKRVNDTFSAGDTQVNQEVAARVLAAMKYESQVAGLIRAYVQGAEGLKTERLNDIFFIVKPTDLNDVFRGKDPLEDIDPRNLKGALSPVGLVHLYRQFFFDLGTFVGEPVEHIWLAPGTTTELYEVSTRRSLVERTSESSVTRDDQREIASKDSDELSSLIKAENESSTKFGVSSTNTANIFVYQGTLTTSLDLSSVRKEGRENAHKQNRESSEKAASQIKQEFKTTFRTVTETTDTRSRRYILENKDTKLINYELRRKMRRVGVQLQDIGTRMCWIMFVDDPGLALGLPELVHVAESADVASIKEPEKLPSPGTLSTKVVVPLPFRPILDYSNNRAQYEYQGIDPNGLELAIIKGDEDDDDSQIIIAFKGYKFDPPQTGYRMNGDIRVTGVQGGKIAAVRSITVNPADQSFDIIMQRVNFGGENVINLELELHFDPLPEEVQRVAAINADMKQKYDEEKRQALRANYVQNVRARIQDARDVASRDSNDLREEERTVVYRKLLERLMIDTWRAPNGLAERRVAHLRSEVIRSLFDIDAMLYFVAPEWWVPRREGGRLNFEYSAAAAGQGAISLTESDILRWGGVDERRAANYQITEKSAPAPLGSSLGWLIQLDGDNLRNAFLNAPWVKAVIPIRPGRELAALNWLRSLDGSEDDGWDLAYAGTDQEIAEIQTATGVQDVTVGDAVTFLATKLQNENNDIKATLQSEQVFEHGFSHLQSGFDAGLPANEIFDQWISVVPTDQIVAREYVETDFTDTP